MTTTDLSQRLKGKVAVVTAVAQGIGRATAERLAAEGAQVHGSDLNAGAIEGAGFASTERLDGTDRAAVRAYMARFEKIDILVHAVGYVHQGTIEECEPEDWRRSMTITLDSAYQVLGAAIPKMKVAGGNIVTIASVAGSIKGLPRREAYGAAKAGVIGLTKSVAADYLAQGIPPMPCAPVPSPRPRLTSGSLR